MPKRAHDGSQEPGCPPKRIRLGKVDRISLLSDELLLRILSHVSTGTLVLSQRVSKKFHAVAGDSQLWKAAYYNRFVRPRASRLPGLREGRLQQKHLFFSSKTSKWLDEEHLLHRGKNLDWKRQYKLRHNWSQGTCAVNEIPVTETTPAPSVLVRYHNGIVFTLDRDAGLRAWSPKENRTLLASLPLPNDSAVAVPSSLAVNGSEQQPASGNSNICLSIGFSDGSFSLFWYDHKVKRLLQLYRHVRSSIGQLAAVALSFPILATVSESNVLSVYKFSGQLLDTCGIPDPGTPRLLHSSSSYTASLPLDLSIRSNASSVVVSIAFALRTYFSGISASVQEMHFSSTGELIESRSAAAVDSVFEPVHRARHHHSGSASTQNSAQAQPDRSFSKPTSISYTHPYLLLSHPDNTLTLYLVTSTKDRLAVSAGSRLWGHTSSISVAHVGGRGKAVSVSSRGGELRVWELEGGMASIANRKRMSAGDLSVRIRADSGVEASALSSPNDATVQRGSGLGLALDHTASDDLSMIQGWVGFDEENVVILKGRVQGEQALVVYDFT